MNAVAIGVEDPRAEEVRRLLERHLEFAYTHTPPEDVHAFDVERLLDPKVTFFGCRVGGRLVAVGALKMLDDRHAELKSMHTAAEARGRGVARMLVAHLLDVARTRGATRVSLETGTGAAFAPARSLYAAAGFVPCGPFGDYAPGPNNTFMTVVLT